jgi:hypothetical protein
LSKEPKEEMDPRWNFNLPDSRGVYRFHSPEIYDPIEGLRGVFAIRLEGPNYFILAITKDDSGGKLHHLIPVSHQGLINYPPESTL